MKIKYKSKRLFSMITAVGLVLACVLFPHVRTLASEMNATDGFKRLTHAQRAQLQSAIDEANRQIASGQTSARVNVNDDLIVTITVTTRPARLLSVASHRDLGDGRLAPSGAVRYATKESRMTVIHRENAEVTAVAGATFAVGSDTCSCIDAYGDHEGRGLYDQVYRGSVKVFYGPPSSSSTFAKVTGAFAGRSERNRLSEGTWTCTFSCTSSGPEKPYWTLTMAERDL